MNNINDNDHIVLCAVRYQPLHGYDLFKTLSKPSGIGGIWRIKIGKLYAILNNLEAKGYITSTEEKTDNRPPKKTFSITKEGEKRSLEWLQTPVAHGREFRQIFLAKLYYARFEGENTEEKLIKKQIEKCQLWLNNIKFENKVDDGQTSFLNIVKQFRIKQIEAYIEWLNWLLSEVKSD